GVERKITDKAPAHGCGGVAPQTDAGIGARAGNLASKTASVGPLHAQRTDHLRFQETGVAGGSQLSLALQGSDKDHAHSRRLGRPSRKDEVEAGSCPGECPELFRQAARTVLNIGSPDGRSRYFQFHGITSICPVDDRRTPSHYEHPARRRHPQFRPGYDFSPPQLSLKVCDEPTQVSPISAGP